MDRQDIRQLAQWPIYFSGATVIISMLLADFKIESLAITFLGLVLSWQCVNCRERIHELEMPVDGFSDLPASRIYSRSGLLVILALSAPLARSLFYPSDGIYALLIVVGFFGYLLLVNFAYGMWRIGGEVNEVIRKLRNPQRQ